MQTQTKITWLNHKTINKQIIYILMKPCNATIVFISVVVTLFFVTLVTLLSSRVNPEQNDVIVLLVNDKE